MPYFLQRIWDPASYQGGTVSRRYFEGWYFKQADAKEQRVFAVIPGVSFSADGTSNHAFVQTISNGGRAHYFSYPIESFTLDSRIPFNIRIGDNTFTKAGMTLRRKDSDAEVHGDARGTRRSVQAAVQRYWQAGGNRSKLAAIEVMNERKELNRRRRSNGKRGDHFKGQKQSRIGMYL